MAVFVVNAHPAPKVCVFCYAYYNPVSYPGQLITERSPADCHNPELIKNLRYNVVLNLLDGGFFGEGLGFASFVTVIPLFVSSLTDSAVLIGLIPAIHTVGWQLPQLLTAGLVSRQPRYKPLVLVLTIQERLPFLCLALVAWFLPRLEPRNALALTFALLVWQGLGGGFTATAWQSLIARIILPKHLGTSLGTQSAVENLLASGTAVIAGLLLERSTSPIDFGLCFLQAGIANVATWTTPMAMTIEFCGEDERPAYIGLANTLVAPGAIAAPCWAVGWPLAPATRQHFWHLPPPTRRRSWSCTSLCGILAGYTWQSPPQRWGIEATRCELQNASCKIQVAGYWVSSFPLYTWEPALGRSASPDLITVRFSP